MKDKNIIVSTVRGIAIILVVYGHVLQRSMVPFGEDFFLNPAFKVIYTFHMPLFVLISGYVMAYSLSRRDVFGVFKTRCKTLLVPFISWGILGAVSIYFVDIIDKKGAGITSLPMGLANELFLKPSIWILVTLFVSSCMLLYSIKLEKRFGKIIFVLIYLLILAIPYNEYCSLFFIKWLYLFYMAGYFLNKCGIKVTGRLARLIVLIVSSATFVVLASYWTKADYIYINKMNFISNDYFYDMLRMLYRYGLAFLGITVVFCIGSYLSKTKIQSILDNIGVYSLDIYLIQRYIVEGLYPRFVYNANIKFDFNSPFFLYLIAPLVTIVSVYLCILISKLLIRRNNLLNTLLLGNRA